MKPIHQWYCHWLPGHLGVHLVRAEEVERIISSSKHTDKSLLYNFIKPFLKLGLLTSNGQKWAERRRLLTPAFHFNILQQFHITFKDLSDQLIVDLENESRVTGEISLHDNLSKFTLHTILGLYIS